MSHGLDASCVEKNSNMEQCTNGIIVGGSSMKGRRKSMEDVSITLLDIGITTGRPLVSCVAIFDGHSGRGMADYAADTLPEIVLGDEAVRLEDLADASPMFADPDSVTRSFVRCDNEGLYDDNLRHIIRSGTTCVAVLIWQPAYGTKEILCCNVGDSRAVLWDDGAFVALSVDHKPASETEKRRILAAGHYGVIVHQILGGTSISRIMYGKHLTSSGLSLSRAFGDYEYKDDRRPPSDWAVTCEPTFVRYTLDVVSMKFTGIKFILLACDGVWDVMGSAEAVAFCCIRIRQQMTNRYWGKRIESMSHMYELAELDVPKLFPEGVVEWAIHPTAICEDLIDTCCIRRGSTDNLSATLIVFKTPGTMPIF